MKLVLMQHGEAVSKQSNPERPLTEQGEADVKAMAAWFKIQSLQLARVVHSGKRRAEQTAQLLAEVAAPALTIQVQPGLAPDDDIDAFVDVMQGWQGDSVVVGHLPFLARLAMRLLEWEHRAEALAFQPGTMVCLETSAAGRWQLNWMVRPGQMMAV